MQSKTVLLISGLALLCLISSLIVGALVVRYWNPMPVPSATPQSIQSPTPNERTVVDFVYFYNQDSHALLKVYPETTRTEMLSLVMGELAPTYSHIAVSNDGRYVAMCASQPSATADISLLIYDLDHQQILFQRPYEGLGACHPSVFSADSTQVIFSFVFYHDDDDDTTAVYDWTMQVLDIRTGAVMHELSNNMPNLPSFLRPSVAGTDNLYPILAMPMLYAGDQIWFVSAMALGGDGATFPGGLWNVRTDAIVPVEPLSLYSSDILAATGEIVYAALDDTIDVAPLMGIGEPTNSVEMLHDGTVTTIYQNSAANIGEVRFVNGGREVLISLIYAEPLANGNYGEYVLIGRDGHIRVLDQVDFMRYKQARGTYDGALLADTRSEQGALRLLSWRDDQATVIWELSDTGGAAYQFLWSPSMATAPNLAPFQAVP